MRPCASVAGTRCTRCTPPSYLSRLYAPFPSHERDDLLEPAEPRRAREQDLDPPPLPLGVARVHAEELGGEEAGLVAAGAGADLEDRVPLVVRVLRDQEATERRVHLFETGLERGQLGARELAEVGVLTARELAVVFDLLRQALARAPAENGLLELRALLGDLRELTTVRDHARVGDQTLELLVAPLDLRQPIEHRSAHPHTRGERTPAAHSESGPAAGAARASLRPAPCPARP